MSAEPTPATLVDDDPDTIDDANGSFSTDATARPRSVHLTAVERFKRQVDQHPHRRALCGENSAYSYAELDHLVTSLAAQLSDRGVGLNSRVGVHAARTPETVALILAIGVCNATYVVIDPALPESRRRFVADDAAIQIAVVDDVTSQTRSWISPHIDVVTIGALLESSVSDASAAHEALPPDPHSLTYVMYTSGSTGQPKGVQITQKNLAHLLSSWDDVMGAATDETVCMLLSALSFDASVTELFWPLCSGATLVVAPDVDALTIEVGPCIERFGVTHLQCTPTRATLLLAADEDRRALHRIQHLVIGGEALTRSLADELFRSGIARITNAYGPTEATVWATTLDVGDDEQRNERGTRSSVVAIGRPLRNVRVAITQPDGTLSWSAASPNVPGELVIVGPFVSPGYLNRSELSAQRFFRIVAPGRKRSEQAYRTGDLVSWRPDGGLEFHGRIDDQVKVRGQRIELGEVEAALATDVTIQQAAVCVDPTHRDDLIAFVVPRTGQRPDATELGNRLRRRLPEVMVPRRYVVMSELPRTTSSKVDRQELVRSFLDGAESATSNNPGSASQQTESVDVVAVMAHDFATVLDVDRVGPDQDFFSLGGHSIRVVELIERIATRTGIRLPLRVLLGACTPRALAAVLEHRRGGTTSASKTPNVIVRFNTADQTVDRKLFFIHGASGNVIRYRALAHSLRDVVNMVGIQAHGVEGDDDPDQSLSQMVTRYADAIESQQRDGRIDVGGYSAGGIVALHVGGELIRRGRTLRTIVMLDSFTSNDLASTLPGKARDLWNNLLSQRHIGLFTNAKRAYIGWKRRKDWDEQGLGAVFDLGYRDLFDYNIALIERDEPPAIVAAPGLLIRSGIEHPMRVRDYDLALGCPTSVIQREVIAKHDELLMDFTIRDIDAHVRAFLLTH